MKKDMPQPRVRWHDPPKPRPMPRASYKLPGRKVPRELEHWTGFTVIAIADAAQRHYSKALRKLNMTITEFIVLAVIVRQDGICATDIAERCGLSRQRISTVICEFDRSAWIMRDVKINDFRYKGVWLSNLGRDAWEEACAAIHRADRQLHLDMPNATRIAMRKLLLRLVPGSASEVRMARRGW